MKRFCSHLCPRSSPPLWLHAAVGNGFTFAGGNATDAAHPEASTEPNIYMWQQYISDAPIGLISWNPVNNCKINLSYRSATTPTLSQS